jgi:hypothetical protein
MTWFYSGSTGSQAVGLLSRPGGSVARRIEGNFFYVPVAAGHAVVSDFVALIFDHEQSLADSSAVVFWHEKRRG